MTAVPHMRRPVIILGAGPSAIGAALALGPMATVLERGPDVAGLSRSLNIDGVIFDLGGHSFHTPHQEVRDLVFGALPMEEQKRDAWCWREGDWIAYPFQKNVAQLSNPDLRAACSNGMAAAGDASSATDFDTYLDLRFGREVAAAFMRPYNRKLWGSELSRLSTAWTTERVAAPQGAEESFSHDGGKRLPLQAETRIAYPARGGFGSIFEALARGIKDLRFGSDVIRIDPAERTLVLSCGTTLAWERIISTLPLTELTKIVIGMPDSIRHEVAGLEAIPVSLVMVVLEGQAPYNRQRVYCADPNITGHKIVLNNTSSRWLRAQPRHGIQVEVSNVSGYSTSKSVTAGLRDMGLLAGCEIRRIESVVLPLGYPAPTHNRDRIVTGARHWLASQHIHLCGRFAEWAYINSDEALARGLALGRLLERGASV